MSLFRMTELAANAESFGSTPVLKETAMKRGAATSRRVSAALDKVAAFIPSEVIGIYVAGLGIFSPTEPARRWTVFAVAAVLIPVFIALSLMARRGTRGSTPKKPLRPILILSAMGLCAFAVWAAAMPDTPFLTLSSAARQFGGWGAIVLGGVLPPVAKCLKVA